MKLTTEITELLFELSDIESTEHTQLLIGDGGFLRHNLVTLYGKTANPASHDLIIEIMDKCGYSWFGPLMDKDSDQGRRSDVYSGQASSETTIDSEIEFQLSDDEFLNLLPINSYFH